MTTVDGFSELDSPILDHELDGRNRDNPIQALNRHAVRLHDGHDVTHPQRSVARVDDQEIALPLDQDSTFHETIL